MKLIPGKIAPKEILIDTARLISDYFYFKRDLHPIKFGTSGHRGSAFKRSFNESHILAISQAISDFKKKNGTKELIVGIDTHALSTPAKMSALRVFAANGIEVIHTDKFTPTPLVSFMILEKNRNGTLCDGIVLTPSHNPPEDGGYKYNPPNGGPADTDVTAVIEKEANAILQNSSYKVLDYEEAIKKEHIKLEDFITPYVESLSEIVDMEAIQKSGLRLCADALGGSTMQVYEKIKDYYNLTMDLRHNYIDYRFSFMSLDHDGKIRMDCSSPYAMASLLEIKDRYDLAFANDTDGDRHGIVTPIGGLMNPNHFLSVAIWYLFAHRKWPKNLKIGKTFVTSSMIDRVAKDLGVKVYETPVGFKWFAEGLYERWLGFAGEESAGASFLRKDGTVWTTDKDGIIMALLAAEIKAKSKDPALLYQELEEKFGKSYYERIDIPADEEIRTKIKSINPQKLGLKILAGEPVIDIFTQVNGMSVGGVKIVTQNGWIALRPSGTEDIYKIYAESFLSQEHLKLLQQEAQNIVRKLI
ncbi:alpha-D-glucose phosphate-specific phosphoglucomutase [Nitratiruptor sp. YY09-18]|uniref:alpha-D-glucose phosphate-specific phosphoglucomutase n=1 Tax=Nitratiruptor sp. YY09-18 TaxID=2724901 RepID=UPI001916089C|nr:alpha-D-glucose phosphate-specific phosphoglucomutase [Nitratiruptor sp. YY09-18]BCD68130.1 phosphoglucomutase [Nitratiruptor sp. YY09-18]